MNKPFVIAQREMKEKITNVVNECVKEIPADVIADFLDKLTAQIRVMAEAQYNDAVKQYAEDSEPTTE